ncbi:hypothetical protein [Streptomyces sp. NBC_01217]|uniref:hypothetical protein n=1 Tax=Streptomyces sp. NBC_01217 TaxID=2903779 RepID=UPI002E149053|nr:hypothetical protein OG507_32835 [Streptomyces sp. NBC_01217]
MALSHGVQGRLLWGGPAAALLAIPLLTRLMQIKLGQEGVAVRLRGRTSQILWTELASVSVTVRSTERSKNAGLLVLEGTQGQRMEMPLLLVCLSDRQRLLSALERRTAPGTLHGDGEQ